MKKTMILEVLTATLLAGLGGCRKEPTVQSAPVPLECNKPCQDYYDGMENHIKGEFCQTQDGRVLACYYRCGETPTCYELNTLSQYQATN